MAVSIFPPAGAAGAEVFETLQHSSGTFTVDCSTNKTAVLNVNDAYFTPTRTSLVHVGRRSEATALSGSVSSFNIPLTGLSGGIASSPSAGDIVIVAFTASTDQGRLAVFPADWTVLGTAQQSNTHWTNLRVAYKVMGSSPDSSVTVTTSLFADFSWGFAVHVWRSEDETTPIDVTTVTATATGNSFADPAAITTVTNNAVVVAVGAGAFANTSATGYTSPTNLNNFIGAAVQDNNSTVIGIASAVVATAGSFNPAAFTGSTTSSGASWGAVTLAIRPALGATNTATINFTNIPLERKELTVNLSRSNSAISAVPLVWQNGIVGFSAKTSLPIGGAIIEKFFTLGNTLYADSFLSKATVQKTEIITSTQTWTVPAGVSQLELIMCGGGGGGAWGASQSSGGGGGSVDYTVLNVTPGSTHTITIGGGGAGAGSLNAKGSTGGTSSFGSLFSVLGAEGGGSVNNSNNDGPIGGQGSRLGGGGGNGASTSGTNAGTGNNGAPGAFGLGGGGGGSAYAVSSDFSGSPGANGGGRGGRAGTNPGTNAATNSGSGGGGAGTTTNGPGNGGSGIAIIKYWTAA